MEDFNYLWIGKYFFNKTKKCTVKEKMNVLDFIKIKNPCSLRGTIKTIKKQATDLEKTLPIQVSNSELKL